MYPVKSTSPRAPQERVPQWVSRRRKRLPASRPTGIAVLRPVLSSSMATVLSPTDIPEPAPCAEAASSSAAAWGRVGAGAGAAHCTSHRLPMLPALTQQRTRRQVRPPTQIIGQEPLALTAAENLVRVRAAAPVITMRMVKALINSRLPLLQMVPEHDYVAPLAAPEAEGYLRGEVPWYVLGDLHGDFFALHTLLTHIRAKHQAGTPQATPFRVLVLGDVVDRGLHDTETLLLLLEAAMEHPHCFLWLAGNHDDALYLDAGAARFEATVAPSEFKDKLNDMAGAHPFLRALGYLFIALAARLPRAVLFPDGTLATHAGIPLRDAMAAAEARGAGQSGMAKLNAPACLHDFLWTRAAAVATRRPARRTEPAFYGHDDFEAFCRATEAFFPVRRMVRGHDHVAEGYLLHRNFRSRPVLTLNSFGHDVADGRAAASGEGYRKRLCLGLMQKDALPRVDLLPFAPQDFAQYRQVAPVTVHNAPENWPTDSDERISTEHRRAQIAPGAVHGSPAGGSTAVVQG
ncbi:hypothetical protein DB346_25105 [Verrucomicrobia bacterium LW23]|nr:hypothetical protein DB346_25105 [Verrucomicrobia bacterium LW23]